MQRIVHPDGTPLSYAQTVAFFRRNGGTVALCHRTQNITTGKGKAKTMTSSIKWPYGKPARRRHLANDSGGTLNFDVLLDQVQRLLALTNTGATLPEGTNRDNITDRLSVLLGVLEAQYGAAATENEPSSRSVPTLDSMPNQLSNRGRRKPRKPLTYWQALAHRAFGK